MRASEFLRKLTDFIDSVEQLTDDSEDSPDTPSQAVMVPPLQQNIELLKKASGVQSIYDTPEESDEIEKLKTNAGIVTIAAASSNFPSN